MVQTSPRMMTASPIAIKTQSWPARRASAASLGGAKPQ